jgi:hypothetical protein
VIASFLVPSHENGTVVPRWDRDVEQLSSTLSSTALAQKPKTIETIVLHWVDRFAGSPHLAIELGKSKPSGRIGGPIPVLHISTSSVESD